MQALSPKNIGFKLILVQEELLARHATSSIFFVTSPMLNQLPFRLKRCMQAPVMFFLPIIFLLKSDLMTDQFVPCSIRRLAIKILAKSAWKYFLILTQLLWMIINNCMVLGCQRSLMKLFHPRIKAMNIYSISFLLKLNMSSIRILFHWIGYIPLQSLPY